MMNQFKDAFREEAYELLNQLESSLLELEEKPHDEELVSAVFRSMHTIKGSAAMFGFEDISEFAHEVESVLDLLRSGRLTVDTELVNLTLAARDHVRALLDSEPEEAEGLKEESARIVGNFRSIAERAESQATPEAATEDAAAIPPEAEEVEEEERTYRIRFEPNQDIFQAGTNPLLLLRELAGFGEFTARVITEHVPRLSEFDPESCYTSWVVVLTTAYSLEAIRDVFIFVENESTVQIDHIDDSFLFEDTLEYKRLGEILIERGVISENDLKPLLQSQKRIGQVLVEHRIATEEQVESAFDEQQHMRRLQDRKQQEFAASSIRVKSERLDTLVDLVGELVTVRAGLSQTAGTIQSNELTRLVEQTERLISELRDVAMGIRMVPIGTTFRKFKRLIRDLSEDLSKEAEFVTAGGETELDKTVIDRLNDPLVHLIRNSLDHGIETPEQRRAAGKPPAGTIRLSAEHSGASVIISVEDDGAGINPGRVRDRAVAKGLLSPDAELPESELFQLLFAPGFSTAESVTNVSGRGVGMDVVKKEIDSLGGSVSVESTPGRGSKMMLKIPLTLAIIEGLLVRIGNEHFVLPLSAVEECVELSSGARKETGKRRILNIRGEVLPYVRLRDLFEISGEHPEIEQIVVVNAYEGRVGFVVDTVIGDHQTVIKPLGRMYKDVDGLSGATILGDGSVALILDVQRLTRVAVNEDRDVG